MFYRYSLTVPANTAEDSPVSQEMTLTHGIVHSVDVSFPPGCAALVHVSIWRYEHQVWPTNPDADWAWDDYTVEIRGEAFELLDRPYALSLRAWSEDDTFAHTIVCRIGVRGVRASRTSRWLRKIVHGELGEVLP